MKRVVHGTLQIGKGVGFRQNRSVWIVGPYPLADEGCYEDQWNTPALQYFCHGITRHSLHIDIEDRQIDISGLCEFGCAIDARCRVIHPPTELLEIPAHFMQNHWVVF